MEEGEWRQGRRRSGYGSAPKEVIKRRSTRSGDDESINASEDSGASGSAECSYGGEQCGVRLGLTNPN
jgi:hypothetical protein